MPERTCERKEIAQPSRTKQLPNRIEFVPGEELPGTMPDREDKHFLPVDGKQNAIATLQQLANFAGGPLVLRSDRTGLGHGPERLHPPFQSLPPAGGVYGRIGLDIGDDLVEIPPGTN